MLPSVQGGLGAESWPPKQDSKLEATLLWFQVHLWNDHRWTRALYSVYLEEDVE